MAPTRREDTVFQEFTSMTFSTAIFGTIAATLLSCSGAMAAVISVDSDCGGTGTALTGVFTCSPDAGRNDVNKIEIFEDGTGTGDNDFFSLGLGGTLVVNFNPGFSGSAMVVEITNGGASSSHDEAVEIFGSNDGSIFTSLGIANNQTGINDGTRGTKTTVSFSGTYSYLGFRDITMSTFGNSKSTDGFDIDAISVSAVPLPASALMLLAGVAGLGAMRTRRKR